MREFKFRIWDKTSKSFLCCSDDDDLFINMQGDMCLARENLRDAYDLDYLSSSFYEISQFTGLKDKNGKEIYAGDILKSESGAWLCEVRDSPSFAGFDFKIIKAPAGCEWEIGDNFILSELRINEAGYEVFGNVYENSELLGGKNE